MYRQAAKLCSCRIDQAWHVRWCHGAELRGLPLERTTGSSNALAMQCHYSYALALMELAGAAHQRSQGSRGCCQLAGLQLHVKMDGLAWNMQICAPSSIAGLQLHVCACSAVAKLAISARSHPRVFGRVLPRCHF